MPASSSDFDVRLLICRNCGAPLDVPVEGGRVQCEYCHVTSILGARPLKQLALSGPADPLDVAERDRIALLRAQAKQYDDTRAARNPCSSLVAVASEISKPSMSS